MLLIESFLVEYQITMFSDKGHILASGLEYYERLDEFGRTVRIPRTKYLYIVLDEPCKHFHAIKFIKAFLCKEQWCDSCKIGWTHQGTHKCDAVCRTCRRANCDQKEIIGRCVCNAGYCNALCHQVHKSYVCSVLNKCDKCHTFKKKGTVHICLN